MTFVILALALGLIVGYALGWQYAVFRDDMTLEEMEAIARTRHAMQQKEVVGRLRQTAQAQRSKCQN